MAHAANVRAAIVAAAVIWGFGGPAVAQDPASTMTVRDYEAAWAHASALEGAEVRYASAHTLIHTPSENAVYLFTKWSHPAHPAYLRSEVLDLGGGPSVAVDLVASGDVAAAEAWADQWEALMRAEIVPPPSPAELAEAARSMIDSASAPGSDAGS